MGTEPDAFAFSRLPAIASKGIVMSAEIIRFIPRPKGRSEQTDFPTIAFRSAMQADHAASNHAGTAPSEYAPSEPSEA